MHENTSVPAEISETAKHLITRRTLLKQAGAAGVALTALYIAPSFSSFGPQKAFASATGGDTTCDLCANKRKPVKLTMEYTGLASAGSNSQDPGKVSVVGSSGGAMSPVYIVVSDHVRFQWSTYPHGNHTHDAHDHRWMYFSGEVAKGAEFCIDAAAAEKVDDPFRVLKKLKSKTFVYVFASEADAGNPNSTPLQEIEFHTSCSQPLSLGDGFGTLLLNGFIDKLGQEDCDVTRDPPSESSDCFDQPGKKIESLVVKYTGHDSTNESHSQPANKSGVTDFVANGPNFDANVYIVASEKAGGLGKVWFSGDVDLLDSFTLNPGHIFANKLKANTWYDIFDEENGTLLQRVQMHTSCSQPLDVGNKFGAIEVMPGFVLV